MKQPRRRRRGNRYAASSDQVSEIFGRDVLEDQKFDDDLFVADLRTGRRLLGLTLQKHERDAVKAIYDTAARHGVKAKTISRGRHPVKVILEGKSGRHVIGIAGSPRDPHWCVRVARKQAEQACARIAGNMAQRAAQN